MHALEASLGDGEGHVEQVVFLLGEVMGLDPGLDSFPCVAIGVVHFAQLVEGYPHGVS